MIIDFILEHITFLKQIQSLGTKHVLEHVAILRHFTDTFKHLHNSVTKHIFIVLYIIINIFIFSSDILKYIDLQ